MRESTTTGTNRMSTGWPWYDRHFYPLTIVTIAGLSALATWSAAIGAPWTTTMLFSVLSAGTVLNFLVTHRHRIRDGNRTGE